MSQRSLTVTDANYHAIVRTLIADNRKVPRGSNLQNLPSKGAGNRVRNCFIPRKGYTFLGADLSQVEPRIMSHIMYTKYDDNSLRQIFVNGTDLYTTMAVRTFSLAEEYCVDKAYDPSGTYKPRALMKTGVLAVAYDQSPSSFAKKMNVTDDVAAMFFDNFDVSFPSFRTMVADIRESMGVNGFAETLYGRKRRFPNYSRLKAEVSRDEAKLMRLYIERKPLLTNPNRSEAESKRLAELQRLIEPMAYKRGLVSYWERAAFNSVIQGSGADILKMNGNRMARLCKARGFELNASIHDELMISVPDADVTPETIALVRDIMTQTVTLSVPLTTDIVIAKRWMQDFSEDEWDFANGRPLPQFADKYK
jgi:DNA polymerase-1